MSSRRMSRIKPSGLRSAGNFGKLALLVKAIGALRVAPEASCEEGALGDEEGKSSKTALMGASDEGQAELVKLLLDEGAAIDEKGESGKTALMGASEKGHTEVVKLLLDRGASVNEKDEDGWTVLMRTIAMGDTVLGFTSDAPLSSESVEERYKVGAEVVKLLLDKGAAVDEEDKEGKTALLLSIDESNMEVAKLLLEYGVSVDKDQLLPVLSAVVAFDEDQLGHMAAAQIHRRLLMRKGSDVSPLEATAEAVLELVRLAGFTSDRARQLRSSDPRSADDHQVLFIRLQLAAAACLQNDELGVARSGKDVQELFCSKADRKALEWAVHIEAKELLAQPVVRSYIEVMWGCGFFADIGGPLQWALVLILLLLQVLFVLPIVMLVPPLEPWLTRRLDDTGCSADIFLLHLPVVKFGLQFTANLALALALTLIPAASLATAPVAPLLLVWVGSGLLWESRQFILWEATASSPMARLLERLVAYWADNMNRADSTALVFSLAALVAAVSADDSEDATAMSLRAVAVLLLWFRLFRVLLVSPRFGPYVLIFFRMLFGDLLYFLVLLLFLLVAFAASWTVLLEPSPLLVAQQFDDEQAWRWTLSPAAALETAGCADELGGVHIGTTLLRLLEGALTGSDLFVCARESTKAPAVAWLISLLYVILTSVLLVNMLIAMCAADLHTELAAHAAHSLR